MGLAMAARAPGALGVRFTGVIVAFLALLVESLPFLLAGSVLAALLQRGSLGRRVIASAAGHPRLAAALAPLSGSVLPLCDCGLLPVARQLHAGGVTARAVNGFVAGAPLTNPIVILSTLVAFPGSPGMVVGRVAVGLSVAMIVSALAPPPGGSRLPMIEHDHDHAGERPSILGAITDELTRTGPTLVVGALAAGVLKGFLPDSALASVDAQPLVAAGLMMILAFVMSICSQADAFVAASLPVGNLPRLAFLVLGPMFDLRLAALYRREFGTRWLAGYAAVVVPSVLVLTTVWATWGPS
jgi:uncharacterized membrane protein YraQ (UPF0718 family)